LLVKFNLRAPEVYPESYQEPLSGYRNQTTPETPSITYPVATWRGRYTSRSVKAFGQHFISSHPIIAVMLFAGVDQPVNKGLLEFND